MQLECLSFATSKPHSKVDWPDLMAQQPYNESLVHQLVVAYQANGRSGTKAQKSRAQVKSGGRKPWRQKGTGRARAGCKTGPLWRGGGVTFAATGKENYSQKINKKAYRAAVRSILAQIIREERLMVLDQVVLPEPKTKAMASQLNALGLQGQVYVVVDQIDPNALLASANLVGLMYGEVKHLNPVALVHCDRLVISAAALKQLEGWLA